MSEEAWKTGITEIQPNEVRLRGYRIDELMGKISFTEAIYLAIIGELPSSEIHQMMEAILVSSIDHGTTPPSALAARTAASTGAPLNAAVACGLLSINRFHGGAIEDCMLMLEHALAEKDENKRTLQVQATETLESFKRAKKRIPGLGHRVHSNDPRTSRLFGIADELGLAREASALLRAIQESIAATGKQLPINVDGAIAALLVDLAIPSPLANAFFFMARTPGLVAHVFEEQTRERPMRRIHPTNHGYDGPSARTLSIE
jgi:citrate synthase